MINAAGGRFQANMKPALPPGTVSPTVGSRWQGKLVEGGLRVTILIDASPTNPGQPVLHEWDLSYLLRSLSSLLEQVRCSSVRVVAFNLEEQKEIFRADRFDRAALHDLSHALRNFDLWAIPYQSLERNRPTDFLVELVNKELTLEERSDAVIFLGPNTRIFRKPPSGILQPGGGRAPQFFYFEYFHSIGGDFRGHAEFPDSIHYLTNALHGTVFTIHSPGDFLKDISKMLSQLRPVDTKKPSAQ
jgi:hypothetical protein